MVEVLRVLHCFSFAVCGVRVFSGTGRAICVFVVYVVIGGVSSFLAFRIAESLPPITVFMFMFMFTGLH